MACEFSNVVVNSSPVLFVSDSVYCSVDSGMSDIVMESNYSVYFTGKWYLQVFDTSVFLAETLNVLRDINKIKSKYIRTNLHYFVVHEVNPLALPDKILLLVEMALHFWWNYIRYEVSTNCFILICIHNGRLTKCQKGKVKV